MADAKPVLVSAAVAVVVAAGTTVALLPRRVETAPAQSAAADVAPPTPAALGTDVAGEVADSRGAETAFVFQVPDDAVQAEVTLDADDGAVEFRAACTSRAPERADDWTWRSRDEGGPADLSITRHADDAFRPGPLVVAVRPVPGGRHGGKPLAFKLRTDVARLAPPTPLAWGRAADEETSPERGRRRDFVLDVPAGTKTLRLDLVDAERDLDLLVSSKAPPLDRDAAEWSADTALCRESLVIDDAPAGKLWIGVVDPSVYDAPVKFRLVATPSDEPPAETAALPAIAIPADPRGRAVAAVVEIVVGDGTGSGTIVREDGLILTALHVIGDRAGDDERPITVALDLDPTRVTRELFHAKLVLSDEALDLALIRVESDIYGRKTPKGLRLPACPVAFDAPRLGEEVTTIGFPEPAGTGTRAPVMLSRGVVAGFERERSGLRVKTDAFVAAGSSGGAALDASWRLVGVPVFVMNESEGTAQTGFLVPTSELPAAWREMMAK